MTLSVAPKLHIVAINAAVLIALILGANVTAALWLDLHPYVRMDGATDPRAMIPAYADHEHAKQVFRDFYRTTTSYSSYEGARLAPFRGNTTNIDDEGLRVVRNQASTTGTLRFFGGSTMWGTGVDDDHTIPQLVQIRLPEMRVINYGQSGFVAMQSVAALLKAISVGEPLGTVIFYDGANDILTYCQGAIPLSAHAFEPAIRQALMEHLHGREEPHHLRDATIGSTRALIAGQDERSTSDLAEVPSERCEYDPSAITQITDRMWASWLAAKALTESFGGRFISVLQPVASVGTPDRAYLPETLKWDGWYRTGYDLLRLKVSANPSWTHDLSRAFDGTGPTYIDWVHVSERGNTIIAEKISKIIRSAGGAALEEQR